MSTLKTGKVKTTTIADELDTESTAVTNVINGSAKAWVNFRGTSTVAIRRDFNVSSLVDSGTGIYIVNFTTAMTDANYSTIFSWWDRIFNSKSSFERKIKMPIGVEGDHEQNLLQLILRPFTK